MSRGHESRVPVVERTIRLTTTGSVALSRIVAGTPTEPYDVTVQAVSKHLKVLEGAGLVSRRRDAQRRPVHLEAEVFDLMTKWIERYRRQAEERYRRLDDVLASMPDDPPRRPTRPTNPSEKETKR